MRIHRSIVCALLAFVPQSASAQITHRSSQCDFDGDGKADPAIVRNVGGGLDWWVRLSTGSVLQFTWGMTGEAGARVTCHDFDGDGKADATVWRPGTGNAGVYWSRLSTGGIRAQPWGLGGDITWLSGDYDGDGRDDHAVYRNAGLPGDASGYLILESSTGSLRAEAWGLATDLPQVNPDFDGDGRTDFAQRRDSFIWRKFSSGGFDVVNWGLPYEPVRHADFDGDGRTDIAIARVAPALQWWIRSSATGAPLSPYGSGYIFGVPGDTPVSADYDGDGRADVAVWRFDGGTWWIQGSAAGLMTIVWGGLGDHPVVGFTAIHD